MFFPISLEALVRLLVIWGEVAMTWATLLGAAALISVIVNIFKELKVVEDGVAHKWVAFLNLLLLGVVVAVKYYDPAIAIEFMDEKFQMAANILLMLSTYITQLAASGGTYKSVRGLPIIGFTHSGS